MPGTMTAAVLHGPEDLRIEEVLVPSIAEDEVLVKVDACGICGTDVHILRGHFPVPNLPLIPGHEFSGRVVEVGSAVDRVTVGEPVTADINIGCDRCYYCRHQMRMFCPQLSQIGVHRDGAFAEYVKAPAAAVYRLPDHMTPEQGAYVEPLACAMHGQERAEIRAGSTVAIIGAGPMGLVHVQLSKLRGAAQIIASEPNAARRAKAADLGADVVLDPASTDAVEAVSRVDRRARRRLRDRSSGQHRDISGRVRDGQARRNRGRLRRRPQHGYARAETVRHLQQGADDRRLVRGNLRHLAGRDRAHPLGTVRPAQADLQRIAVDGPCRRHRGGRARQGHNQDSGTSVTR